MVTCIAPDAEPISKPRGDSPRSTPARPRTNERRVCRVCGHERLFPYLNLGKQALANALVEPTGPIAARRHPLRLLACLHCKLTQLSHVVPREVLYTTYPYRSGVSAGWRMHCNTLAREYAREGMMLDIASNDGTLVNAFRAAGMQEALGVEPSSSFADCNYPRVTQWWSSALVEHLNLVGQVAVLTAQNVLGHVDDVQDFMAGIALALAPDGVAIIEVPYVCDMLDTLAFDTVYHEHLSYWSVTALVHLAKAHGLAVADVQPLAVHGGSIRAILRKSGPRTPRLDTLLVRELHELKRSTYLAFSERVTRRIAEINETLLELNANDGYVGFGAAAKTAIMLGCLDVRAYPTVVYDDNREKWGKLIPGTRVEIAEPPPRWDTRPIVVFAWNWADAIITRLRAAGCRSNIFVLLPKLRWYTA